jgi:hypothetical protein
MLNCYRVKDWEIIFAAACRCGWMEMIDISMLNGASNYQLGLLNACEGGKLEVVKKLGIYTNAAFLRAVKRGHMEIVKYIDCNLLGSKLLDSALIAAAKYGHLELTEYFLNFSDKISEALAAAYSRGRQNIITLLQSAPITPEVIYGMCEGGVTVTEFPDCDMRKALKCACIGGNVTTVKAIGEKNAEAFLAACINNNIKVMRLFGYTKIENDYSCYKIGRHCEIDTLEYIISFHHVRETVILRAAGIHRRLDVFKLMDEVYECEWEDPLEYICCGGSVEILEFVLAKMAAATFDGGLPAASGPGSYSERIMNKCMTYAGMYGSLNIIKFLVSIGSKGTKLALKSARRTKEYNVIDYIMRLNGGERKNV